MEIREFTSSLQSPSPPHNLSQYLIALWYDAKNNWQKAHLIAQDIENKNGAWIHAYLHRKEGDAGNANYWYSKAGRPMPTISLEKEYQDLLVYFLKTE
jgi:hypothetical protein